jgi:hypothetical protein
MMKEFGDVPRKPYRCRNGRTLSLTFALRICND